MEGQKGGLAEHDKGAEECGQGGFCGGKKNESRWCYIIPCDHVITVKKYNPERKRTGNVEAKCKIKQP